MATISAITDRMTNDLFVLQCSTLVRFIYGIYESPVAYIPQLKIFLDKVYLWLPNVLFVYKCHRVIPMIQRNLACLLVKTFPQGKAR